jgi:hypothetical protein
MSTPLNPEIVQPNHLLAGKSPHVLLGGLTLKQAAFVDKFIQTQNATESALYAYNYESRDVAASKGSQLLRLGKIREEIQRRLGTHIASSEEVLQRLTIHARGDLTDILEPDGSINLKSAKKRGKSQLLKKLKVKKRTEFRDDGTTIEHVDHEYEIHDPQAALNTLAKVHGLLSEKPQEVSLNPNDISRLGESLLASMLEAAQRMRAETENLQLPATQDVTPTSSSA